MIGLIKNPSRICHSRRIINVIWVSRKIGPKICRSMLEKLFFSKRFHKEETIFIYLILAALHLHCKFKKYFGPFVTACVSYKEKPIIVDTVKSWKESLIFVHFKASKYSKQWPPIVSKNSIWKKFKTLTQVFFFAFNFEEMLSKEVLIY
jgi:hypothetical protein